MQTLENIKRQIELTEDLCAVVRTMKALSAVSIRQYQRAVASLGGYYRTVEMGLHVVLQHQRMSQHITRKHGDERLAAIVFGSDQGLCGRFNHEVAHHAIDKINGFHVPHHNRIVITVGARAQARLEDMGQAVEACLTVPGSVGGITHKVEQILIIINEWRTQRGVNNVLLLYNNLLSSGGYRPYMTHLLPVDPMTFRKAKEQVWPSRALPTYTMERGALMSALLRQYFFVSVYRACAESLASEHASRLAAMQGASKNIEDHLEQLRAHHRHQRQASITSELLEIVAGFEASITL